MSEQQCTYMTEQDIIDTIKSLSKAQGLYSRLYKSLMGLEENNKEQYDIIMEHLRQQHFKDPVDLAMYFEC